jgi:hypothetical protein
VATVGHEESDGVRYVFRMILLPRTIQINSNLDATEAIVSTGLAAGLRETSA